MGMFDYVDAPAVTCTCGETVSGWQSKDAGCDLNTIKPDIVDEYYSSCNKCGAWHSFMRPPMRNLRPFEHRINGAVQAAQPVKADLF